MANSSKYCSRSVNDHLLHNGANKIHSHSCCQEANFAEGDVVKLKVCQLVLAEGSIGIKVNDIQIRVNSRYYGHLSIV